MPQNNSDLFHKILEEIDNKFDTVKESIRELKDEFKEIKKELPHFSERVNKLELEVSERLVRLESDKKQNHQLFKYVISFLTSGVFATILSYLILRQ